MKTENQSKTYLVVFVSIVVLLLLLSGCSGKTFVCPDGTTVDDPVKCKVEQAKISEEVVEEADTIAPPEEVLKTEQGVPELDEETKEFIKTGLEKLNDYRYDEPNHPTLGRIRVSVRDDKVMYEKLKSDYNLKLGERYNKILFDMTEKTAIAYCDDKDYCIKAEREQTTILDYSLLLPLPTVILDNMKFAKKVSEVRCKTEPCTSFIFIDENGIRGKIWLHGRYAMPLKITDEDVSEIKFELVNFEPNVVSDEDLMLPEAVVNS